MIVVTAKVSAHADRNQRPRSRAVLRHANIAGLQIAFRPVESSEKSGREIGPGAATITMFATDMTGMDNPAEWSWPTHAVWPRNNVRTQQQLCNLDRLVGRNFLLVCLPLIMRDGTGSPVRAAAHVLE